MQAQLEGNQRRLNAIALALREQSLSKSSCAGLSPPPLWWFPQAEAPFQKELKCQTTLTHQINHKVGLRRGLPGTVGFLRNPNEMA